MANWWTPRKLAGGCGLGQESGEDFRICIRLANLCWHDTTRLNPRPTSSCRRFRPVLSWIPRIAVRLFQYEAGDVDRNR